MPGNLAVALLSMVRTDLFKCIASNPDNADVLISSILPAVLSAARCSSGACGRGLDDENLVYNSTRNPGKYGTIKPEDMVQQEVRFYQAYAYSFYYDSLIISGFVTLYIHALVQFPSLSPLLSPRLDRNSASC